ncbi:MAG: 4Fe-4S dicluster domain-containing protein [Promethearchaeota archaeon]
MPILIVKGNKSLCFQENRCQGCEACVYACPTGVITMSDRLNMRAAYIPTVLEGKEESCTFCRRCEFSCPTWAIYVLTLENIDLKGERERNVPMIE